MGYGYCAPSMRSARAAWDSADSGEECSDSPIGSSRRRLLRGGRGGSRTAPFTEHSRSGEGSSMRPVRPRRRTPFLLRTAPCVVAKEIRLGFVEGRQVGPGEWNSPGGYCAGTGDQATRVTGWATGQGGMASVGNRIDNSGAVWGAPVLAYRGRPPQGGHYEPACATSENRVGSPAKAVVARRGTTLSVEQRHFRRCVANSPASLGSRALTSSPRSRCAHCGWSEPPSVPTSFMVGGS